MKTKTVLLLASVIMAALSCTANADTLTFTNGSSPGPSILPGTNTETFDTSLSPLNQTANFTDSFATFAGSAIIADPATSVPNNGNTAEPWPDTTQYLSIQANDLETVTFGSFQPTTIGFYWGSVDAYNQVVLNFVGGTSETFTDTSNPAPHNGDQTNPDTNGYAQFSGNLAIASVVLSTGGTNAFELDNFYEDLPIINGLSGSTPLPAALPLFSAGLALLALVDRRRKRKIDAVIAE